MGDQADLLTEYARFLNSASSKRIVNICLNSEYVQRQKIDLISYLIADNSFQKANLNFVCIGTINTRIEEEKSAHFHIQSREAYFRHAAAQRNIISTQQTELNVKNFTKFSLAFDLLSLAHQNDMKKLKMYRAEELATQSDQSSFILYNCARLHEIFAKFNSLKETGTIFLGQLK